MSGQNTIYEMVTERIVSLLESGVVPWRKPWSGSRSVELPMNYVSSKAYRGINTFLLMCMGFSSRYWMSFKQAEEKGGHVRKGEKATPVIFWKRYETKDRKTGEDIEVPVLRYYNVFNLDQIEGVAAQDAPKPVNHDFVPVDAAQSIIDAMPNPPTITHGGVRAFYRSSEDLVTLPPQKLFEQPEEYYSTVFHELTHATGHEKRLNRRPSTEIRHFGDREYSQEELCAEMGSAYLCAEAGISQCVIENQAAYIDGWLRVLKSDSKMVVVAAAQAQRAADFILGRKFEG